MQGKVMKTQPTDLSEEGEGKLSPPVEGWVKTEIQGCVLVQRVAVIESCWELRLNEALQGSNTTGDLVYIMWYREPPSLSLSVHVRVCV